MTLENPLASASIAGTASADQLDLTTRITLKPSGADALKNMFGSIRISRSELNAEINGTPTQPEILLDLDLLDLGFEQISAQQLTGKANIKIDRSEEPSSTALKSTLLGN